MMTTYHRTVSGLLVPGLSRADRQALRSEAYQMLSRHYDGASLTEREQRRLAEIDAILYGPGAPQIATTPEIARVAMEITRAMDVRLTERRERWVTTDEVRRSGLEGPLSADQVAAALEKATT